MKEGIPASAIPFHERLDQELGLDSGGALPTLPLGWRLMNRMPGMKLQRDRWLLHSPLFGTLVLTQGFSTFLPYAICAAGGGVPLIQGLAITRACCRTRCCSRGDGSGGEGASRQRSGPGA